MTSLKPVVELPLSDNLLDDLVDKAKDYALMNGTENTNELV